MTILNQLLVIFFVCFSYDVRATQYNLADFQGSIKDNPESNNDKNDNNVRHVKPNPNSPSKNLPSSCLIDWNYDDDSPMCNKTKKWQNEQSKAKMNPLSDPLTHLESIMEDFNR